MYTFVHPSWATTRPPRLVPPEYPVTPDEATALRWVSTHLHVLECDRCAGRWIAGRSTAAVFHRCQPRSPAPDWRTPRQRTEQERMSWARRLLGDGLIEAIEQRDGPDSLLRDLE